MCRSCGLSNFFLYWCVYDLVLAINRLTRKMLKVPSSLSFFGCEACHDCCDTQLRSCDSQSASLRSLAETLASKSLLTLPLSSRPSHCMHHSQKTQVWWKLKCFSGELVYCENLITTKSKLDKPHNLHVRKPSFALPLLLCADGSH